MIKVNTPLKRIWLLVDKDTNEPCFIDIKSKSYLINNACVHHSFYNDGGDIDIPRLQKLRKIYYCYRWNAPFSSRATLKKVRI